MAEYTAPNLLYVVCSIFVCAFLGIVLGVLVTNRKKARGVTWFPEGFFRSSSSQRRSSHRRGPDGQEMRNLNKLSSTNTVDMSAPDANLPMSADMSQWSDDDGLDHPPAKKLKSQDGSFGGESQSSPEYDGNDPRPWTQQHLDAADVRNPDILALTPPQGERDMEPGSVDVNVQGPGGLTPLMCASCRGGGIDVVEDGEEEEGTSGNMVQDLLVQGADIHMTLDRSGESSLHLAARYARADAAKRLLDAGANANAQDNTGRTPLHAAVSSDAQGVFQILLRNRATNLNARMNDGTTPLILATRLAIEGMVEDLVNADADINASDDNGKTALHWAAAVNNFDAVRVLISHGANKDAQDNKEETPLFLAAREGSHQAAKMLLESFANKEITDHMDRLPVEVARERMHSDIVRLLEELVPGGSNGHLGGGQSMFLVGMGSTKAKPKRGGKDGVGLRRKPSTKRRKEPSPDPPEEPIYTQLTPVAQMPPQSRQPLYDDSLATYASINQVYLDPSAPPRRYQQATTTVSPTKQRPSLPTSPTHMAAMRGALQQRTGGKLYEYPDYPQLFHYPTPPSQQGEATPHYVQQAPPENTYLTPSPESPGQWSSSSPHSTSDWSESMASPMGKPKASAAQSPQAVFI